MQTEPIIGAAELRRVKPVQPLLWGHLVRDEISAGIHRVKSSFVIVFPDGDLPAVILMAPGHGSPVLLTILRLVLGPEAAGLPPAACTTTLSSQSTSGSAEHRAESCKASSLRREAPLFEWR
jgi:hypothetical protein